jgi:hypothetical protein
MNVKRGLFRLWLVLAVLFVIVASLILKPGLEKEFQLASVVWDLPADCSKARGVAGKDYSVLESQPEICWYEPSKFRKLYPEYDDLSDSDLAEKMNRVAGLSGEAARPWSKLAQAVCIALGIPIAVLLIGAAFFWAIAGFRNQAS